MRNINILSALLSLMLLFTAINSKAQITQTVSFDRDKLVLGEITGDDGNTYTTVGYDYNPTSLEEGSPKLPYKVVHLLVPDGVGNFTVSVTKGESDIINLEHRVFPAQKQQKSGIGETKPLFVYPNDTIYMSSDVFPQETASIASEGYFDGDKHILTLAVSPVQYEPLSNRLLFFSNLSVSVQFSSTRSVTTEGLQPLVRNSPENPEKLELLQNMIENKESVSSMLMKASAARESSVMLSPKRVEVSTIPVYEYCIITSRELATAFERLCGWKRMKGLDAGIVILEDIYADPNITGDLASNYYDNAGKLRQYLTAAWSHGTTYVFLGGDYTVVPVRYSGKPSSEDEHVPSDVYFSDLNSIWDKDGNAHLAEQSNKMDYFPELYVGRLLCSNTNEISTYTEKLLRYEINPNGGRSNTGNMDYLKKAFFMQSDMLQEDKQSQGKMEIFNSIFTTQTLFEEVPSCYDPLPTFPTGNDVIREMNKGYGFFSWACHGGPGAVTTMSKGDNSGSWCIVSAQGQSYYESANGLDNLINLKSPGIVYAKSCTNTPFDDYSTTGYNMGEAFTVAGMYGGPAFLGNTRYGYREPSNYLYNAFARRVAGGERHLGIAEAMSKVDYNGRFVNHSHNLIGCPEMEMWTDIPVILKDFTTKTTPGYITITNNSQCDNWTCHVSELFQNDGLFKHYNSSGMKRFGAGVSIKAYTTMFTGPNSLPFIPELKIQKVEITGNSYIFGTDVRIGNKVGDSTVSGDVTLKSGANVTFEISGEMLLDKGFEIERGGSLELKSFDLMK